MTITVKEDRTSTVHKHSRRIEFVGAEPILLERNYSHGGKHFIPVSASCGWDHGKEPKKITVSGPVLKKDGTPGQTIAQLELTTPASQWWGQGRSFMGPDAPPWLLELFGIEDVPTEDMGQ